MNFRIPDTVIRSLGPDTEPIWYIGEFQVEDENIETIPLPSDLDPATLRATPKRVVSKGDYPDSELT